MRVEVLLLASNESTCERSSSLYTNFFVTAGPPDVGLACTPFRREVVVHIPTYNIPGYLNSWVLPCAP